MTHPHGTPADGAEVARLRAENDRLWEALAAWDRAYDSIFAHCLSNGVFNAWGKPMDCTALNEADGLTRAALSTPTDAKGGPR